MSQRALGVVVMTTARQPIGVLVDASVERCLKSTECAAAILKSARRRECVLVLQGSYRSRNQIVEFSRTRDPIYKISYDLS